MMGFKTKIKQLTSGNVDFGQILITDGNSGFTFSDISGLTTVIGSGISFPGSPTGGTLFYRTDVNLLFYYDDSRSKWLTIEEHTLTCGRSSAIDNTTTYMRVGDATQSSTSGFKMIRNGTIIATSVNNNNTLTVVRNIEIRVNNSAVTKVTLPILTGTTSANIDNFNLDFNINDLIQVVAVAASTGATLDSVIVVIGIAYGI